jgi:hypothetical protein
MKWPRLHWAILPAGILSGSARAELLVSSFNGNQVLRYNETNGAYLGDFVSPGSGGLDGPNFMLFRPPARPRLF